MKLFMCLVLAAAATIFAGGHAHRIDARNEHRRRNRGGEASVFNAAGSIDGAHNVDSMEFSGARIRFQGSSPWPDPQARTSR